MSSLVIESMCKLMTYDITYGSKIHVLWEFAIVEGPLKDSSRKLDAVFIWAVEGID